MKYLTLFTVHSIKDSVDFQAMQAEGIDVSNTYSLKYLNFSNK